jgi:DNA invertase Pin-like site-specific DNA recombinase
LVVTKLDRLARSLPDARAIADELTVRQVRLNLGGSVYDPTDPVGRLLFNVLAMVAEFWRRAWPAAASWCCGSTR